MNNDIDFESLVNQAKVDSVLVTNNSYTEKFMSKDVTEARNRWHEAAVEVDYSRRLAGETSHRYLRAIEQEAKAHEDYCRYKDEAGILERANGGHES